MAAAKKILSRNGKTMLPARHAAKRLRVAPDYIGRLCREGKMECLREGNSWFVAEASILAFERLRATARKERAVELAAERRLEQEAYRAALGLPSLTTPRADSARAPRILRRLFGTSRVRYASAAVAMFLLVSTVVLSGVSVLPGSVVAPRVEYKDLPASVAQVSSPFFSGPVSPLFSVRSAPGPISSFFSRLATFFFGVNERYVRELPPTPPLLVGTTTVVEYHEHHTYPVVERSVVRTESGGDWVPADALTLILAGTYRSLHSEIVRIVGSSLDGSLRNFRSGGLSLADLTDTNIPDDITASNYLPLAGGTLTGALEGTTAAFTGASTTHATTTNLTVLGIASTTALVISNTGGSGTRCLQVNSSGVVSANVSPCGGVGASPGGSDTHVQFNDSDNFGGDAAFTFDKTLSRLTVTNAVFTNATTTSATTTALAITGVPSALLSTNALGSVVASSTLSISYGGTGLSTIPAYGQLLLGQSSGTYALTATSSLGLVGESFRDWYITNGFLTPTTTLGIGIFASSTIGAGGQTTGLTISGGATTSLLHVFQNGINVGGTTFTSLIPTTRTLTVAGTANQIVSSAGAQDLSADRTWTLSFPNYVLFPGDFAATNATTTNATTTGTFYVTGPFASTTQFYAHGLRSCTGDNYLTWDNGIFGCDVDDLGSGSAYPFATLTHFGTTTSATTTPLWLRGNRFSLFASSTAVFENASTTLLSISPLVSTVLTTDATGLVVASSTLTDAYIADNLTISGGTINNTPIGALTPATAVFTNATSTNLAVTDTASTSALVVSGTTNTRNLTISGITGLAQCLQVDSSGVVSGTGAGCAAGGGGSGNWEFFNNSGVRLATTTNQVLIGGGASATTSLAQLEVRPNASIAAYFAGRVGVGTSSPYALFSIHARAGETNTTIFSVASSTASATTTHFAITSTGNVGIGTSSPYAKFSVAGGSIVQIAAGNPVLASSTSVGGGAANNVAVSGSFAYVAAGSAGLRIYDVSEPRAPRFVGSYTGISAAQSIAVSGRFAYVGDLSAGLTIVDVSNPASPALVGQLSFANAYGLAVSGRYIYATNYTGGLLRIIDVADPTRPRQVGSYNTSGNPYGVVVAGKYAYISDQGNGNVLILDISNPGAPSLVGTYSATTFTPAGLYVSGRYLYITDETNGLSIVNVSNPASPALVGQYDEGGSHNAVSVAGRYAYVSNIAGSTLDVVDVSNPAKPIFIGSYAAGGIPEGLFLVGKHAYFAVGSSGLHIVDLNGTDIPAANIGALAANVANISETLIVGGDVFAGGGLSVGLSGIFSRGVLGVTVASTTAANPLAASFTGGSVSIGTTTPYSRLTVWGANERLFEAVTNASTTVFSIGQGGATTTALAITGVPSALLSTNALGSVVASSTLSISYGGTGLSTIPAYGQLLLGQSSGTYALTATSSLGLVGESFRDWYITNGFLTPTTTLGIGIFASSTIGSGTQAGGLTVSGGATTTHALTVLGTGTSTFAGNVLFDNGNDLWWKSSGGVPTSVLELSGDTTFLRGGGGTPTLRIETATGNNLMTFLENGKISIGTSTPYSKLTVWSEGTSSGQAFEIVNNASTTLARFLDDGTAYLLGNVGVGTTTPWRKFSVTHTVSAPQVAIAYDATRYGSIQVNASGNVLVASSNGNIQMLNENLFVCQGGACPTSTATSTAGNLFVENAVTIGDGFSLRQISSTELGLYDTGGVLMVVFDNGE